MPPQRDAFGRPIQSPADPPRDPAAAPEPSAQPDAAEIEQFRQVLAEGLSSAELAGAAEQNPAAVEQLREVQRLMDLHAQGAIDDAALEAAIAALLPE